MASSRIVLFALMGLLIWSVPPTLGDGGVVTVVGSGKDTAEALANALRSAISRNIKNDQELVRTVQPVEILPAANSFVQSYRLLDGGRAGTVSVSANIDLDVVRALVGLTPARLGEEKAKALVVAKGFELPEGSSGKKPEETSFDPFSVFFENARVRFERRNFQVVQVSDGDLTAPGAEEDVASIEALRGLAAKEGARIALGISAHREFFENENSHNREERVVIKALLADLRQGSVLARVSTQAPLPKGRKEQFALDLQRILSEESRELFHELFVEAGKRVSRKSGASGFVVLRVQHPSMPPVVQKFRASLESAKGIRSVTELQFSRGALDFAISPALETSALAKVIQGLASDEFQVTLLEPLLTQDEKRPPSLLVKVSPKAASVSGEEKRSSVEAEDVRL